MALMQDSVSTLNGGVSRQPDLNRPDYVVEEQENYLSDILNSVKARPPAAVLAALHSDVRDDAIFFETEIAGQTDWVVIYDKSGQINIEQYDSTGARTIVSVTGAHGTYLDAGSLADGTIQVLQTGSRIFLLNRTVTAAMHADLTVLRDPELIIWARQSAADIAATIYVENMLFTPNAALDTQYTLLLDGVPTDGTERLMVAAGGLLLTTHSTNELASLIYRDKGSGGELDEGLIDIQEDHWYTGGYAGTSNVTAGAAFDRWEFEYADDTDHAPVRVVNEEFSSSIITAYFDPTATVAHKAAAKLHRFYSEDGLGNQAVKIAGPEKVDALDSLPAQGAPVGFHVRVSGLNESEEDDFYVLFNGDSWEESVAQNIPYKLDLTTMPLELINNGGSLELADVEWGERTVGDEDSAPDPQFIGKTIQSIGTHKGRLFLLCEDSLSMSESDQRITSFFPSTVRQVLDTDPIEFDLSSTSGEADQPQLARHGIGTPGGLLILGEHVQSIVRASDNLWAPGRVSNDILSTVEMDATVPPVRMGEEVIFLAKAGREVTVWSYRLSGDGGFSAENLSTLIEGYLPENIAWMRGSFNEGTVLMGDKDNPLDVYVYRFYLDGTERLMGSWSKWTFPDWMQVRSGYFKDGQFIFVAEGETSQLVTTADVTTVFSMDFRYKADVELLPFGITYPMCLDNKIVTSGVDWVVDPFGTFSAIPYPIGIDNSMIAIVVDGVTGAIREWAQGSHLGISTIQTVVEPEDYVVFGARYDRLVQPSKIYRKKSNGRAIVPVTTERLQLRAIHMLLKDSGPIDVRITTAGREPVTKTLPFTEIGDNIGLFALPKFRRQRVDCPGDAAKMKLEFISNYLTPETIVGFDWEALYHPRALNNRRV